MVVKIVTLYVKQEHLKDFIEATRENQRNSQLESGVKSFDFYQGQDDPTRFVLYEAYDSQDAVEAHTRTAHYKKWVDSVATFYAKPRERAIYTDVNSNID